MSNTDKPIATSRCQAEVIEFLRSPATYGPEVDNVECIETHGALVFLAGDQAYKLKRSVKFQYLDFSTLEKRERTCRHEVDRNRSTAPDIYIGVLPVTRARDGTLTLGREGTPVDWLVVMNRFNQAELFDDMATRCCLPLSLMSTLAEQIADYHDQARTFPSFDGSCILSRVVTQVATSLTNAHDLIAPIRTQAYVDHLTSLVNQNADLLRARSHKGLVRLCHGDLHLRNIVLHDGRPTLFDAIEFDDRLAKIDVLYDLAFLLMDLWHRDLQRHANLCFCTYASKAIATADLAGLAALPMFMSVRAAIRAMVAIDKYRLSPEQNSSSSLQDLEDYINLATAFIEPRPPVLIAIGGLSGTGKTTISAALSPEIGPPPGAFHLRSDVERKRMAGVDLLTPLPKEAYSPSSSDHVYQRLCDRAKNALEAGCSVVVDAVFLETERRRQIEQVAIRQNVPFQGIWLEAPKDKLTQRVLGRKNDASDADSSVIKLQLERKVDVTRWAAINTDRPIQDTICKVRSVIDPSCQSPS
ncbi:MAG: AAA family ATPase [Hyphomicrobiaceae bacterium]